MTGSAPRCWAIRTDRSHRDDLIVPALRNGVLRQGWGYDDSQDLRRIRARLDAGRCLDPAEREAWSRNRRLLPSEPDSVADGDWVVLPNVPDDGLWSIARARPEYAFGISETGDHGHQRTIELLVEAVNPRTVDIPASLRRTTRCQRAMWNLDANRLAVERLLVSRSQRLPLASALEAIIAAAREAASLELARHFGGAELEAPIAALLGRLYGNVERRGGATEQGADLICESADALGVQSRVAVQIKMWKGTASSPVPIQQLARAFRSLPGITGGVVLTTAEACSPEFLNAATALEQETGLPVRVLTRSAVLDLILSQGHAQTHPRTEVKKETS
jgi:hypothetical protein